MQTYTYTHTYKHINTHIHTHTHAYTHILIFCLSYRRVPWASIALCRSLGSACYLPCLLASFSLRQKARPSQKSTASSTSSTSKASRRRVCLLPSISLGKWASPPLYRTLFFCLLASVYISGCRSGTSVPGVPGWTKGVLEMSL